MMITLLVKLLTKNVELNNFIDEICSLQVDHTIVLFLVDPNGDFVEYYGQNKNREQITEEIMLTAAKHNFKK